MGNYDHNHYTLRVTPSHT